jgi:DNA-binding transcriptional ArsR family regulator
MTPPEPTVEELAAAVAELRERVDALEAGPPAAEAAGLAVSDLISGLRGLGADKGVVLYAGLGPREPELGGEVAYQMGRRWDDVLAADRVRSSRPLAALGSPARLDIVAELLAGPVGRQELQDRLPETSEGRLNHHLRELLAAGLVEQPRRGVYQVPVQHVVPIVTLLSCGLDLAADAAAPPTHAGVD